MRREASSGTKASPLSSTGTRPRCTAICPSRPCNLCSGSRARAGRGSGRRVGTSGSCWISSPALRPEALPALSRVPSTLSNSLQTQLHPQASSQTGDPAPGSKMAAGPQTDSPLKHVTEPAKGAPSFQPQKRPISTSSPSTHTPRPGAVSLHTSSISTGLKLIYKSEGFAGWFRGVGPRFVWTSIQSGCMLFLYQTMLRKLEVWLPLGTAELESIR